MVMHELNEPLRKNSSGIDYLIPFEKMHGLGNDFVIINNSHLPDNCSDEIEVDLCKRICDRHLGVGADGMIIIAPVKESTEAIHSWRYYNSDGSVGEMCGNGIRCAAKYIYEHGLSGEEALFKIETLAGDIHIEIMDDEMVRVGMGDAREIKEREYLEVPILSSHGISSDKDFLAKHNVLESKENNLDLFKFDYDYVSMGNPHAISFFNQLNPNELKEISAYGPSIEMHSNFPNKTNVEFARVINPNEIELIVWERGCGFTQACGTGACATAVAAIKRGYCEQDTDIKVKLPGGDLIIRYDSVAEDIFMTGKAEMPFTGNYHYQLKR